METQYGGMGSASVGDEQGKFAQDALAAYTYLTQKDETLSEDSSTPQHQLENNSEAADEKNDAAKAPAIGDEVLADLARLKSELDITNEALARAEARTVATDVFAELERKLAEEIKGTLQGTIEDQGASMFNLKAEVDEKTRQVKHLKAIVHGFIELGSLAYETASEELRTRVTKAEDMIRKLQHKSLTEDRNAEQSRKGPKNRVSDANNASQAQGASELMSIVHDRLVESEKNIYSLQENTEATETLPEASAALNLGLRHQVVKKEKAVSNLQASVVRLQSDIDGSKEFVLKLQAFNSTLQGEIREKTEANGKLLESNKNLQLELNKKSKALDNAHNELRSHKEEKSKRQTADRRLGDEQKSTERLRKEIAELHEKLTLTDQRNEKLENNLKDEKDRREFVEQCIPVVDKECDEAYWVNADLNGKLLRKDQIIANLRLELWCKEPVCPNERLVREQVRIQTMEMGSFNIAQEDPMDEML
jgi:chromosome segregation ATPase